MLGGCGTIRFFRAECSRKNHSSPQVLSKRRTPLPTPPPQGGREPTESAATTFRPRKKLLMHIDAVDLEVVKASLSGIVQEMQNSLFRTGFSTIVRESQDASCALMNAKGEVVAQHVVLPLHIGAFPACCGAIITEFGDSIAEGDAFLINHPYEGGSPHAPDMCVLSPVFVDGALFGFCGSIAHKSDIGGPVPGSCSGPGARDFNEGLHLPAVRYQRGGKADRRHRAHHRRQQPHARAGARRHPRPARLRPARRAAAQRARGEIRQGENPRLLRPPVRIVGSASCARLSPNGRTAASRPSASSTTTASIWKSRCASTSSSTRRATASISISQAPPTRPRGRPMSARRWCRRPAPIA